MIQMSKVGSVPPTLKDQCLFTARDVFTLLANIDELNGYKIRLRENIDGSLQIQIDTNVYNIWTETEIEIV